MSIDILEIVSTDGTPDVLEIVEDRPGPVGPPWNPATITAEQAESLAEAIDSYIDDVPWTPAPGAVSIAGYDTAAAPTLFTLDQIRGPGYTLPVAAAGVLGGVRPASNITVAVDGSLGATTPPAGDDSTKVATTAHVAAALRALVGLAPAELDTLKEIADALAANASSDAALVAVVAQKLAKSANLSDLANIVTARTNLGVDAADTARPPTQHSHVVADISGLGTAATHAHTEYFLVTGGALTGALTAPGVTIGPAIGTPGTELFRINRGALGQGQLVIRIVEGSVGNDRFTLDGEGRITASAYLALGGGAITVDGLLVGGTTRRVMAVNNGSALDIRANGLAVKFTTTDPAIGAFTADAAVRPGGHTVSTLPAASGLPGYQVRITDRTPAQRPAYSDGTSWRWVSDDTLVS